MITAEIKLQLSPSTQCESTHSDETMPDVIRRKLGHELMSQAGIPLINYSSKNDTITVKNSNSLVYVYLKDQSNTLLDPFNNIVVSNMPQKTDNHCPNKIPSLLGYYDRHTDEDSD